MVDGELQDAVAAVVLCEALEELASVERAFEDLQVDVHDVVTRLELAIYQLQMRDRAVATHVAECADEVLCSEIPNTIAQLRNDILAVLREHDIQRPAA